MHLRIAYVEGKWRTAEVISTVSRGYGKYTFVIGDVPNGLAEGFILGFFTWDDSPEQFHREIDIEFRGPNLSNGAFTVQPWDGADHHQPFDVVPSQGTYSFDWRPESVIFENRDVANELRDSWSYSGADIPIPGKERVRMNFWLLRGNPPSVSEPIEIIVNDFSFTPFEESPSN